MAHVLFNTDALTALRAMEADSVVGVEPNPEYCRMAEERVAKGK